MRSRSWIAMGVGCAVVLSGCASGDSPVRKSAQPTIYASVRTLQPRPFPPISRTVIDHVLDDLPCTKVDGPQVKRWSDGRGWSAYCHLGHGARYARVFSASDMTVLSQEVTLLRAGRSSVRGVLRTQWAVVCTCTSAELAVVTAIR